MQAIRKPEPYSLLEYQSRELRVFGVELRPLADEGMPGILAGLRWVGRSPAFRDELTFLVVNLPDRVGSPDIAQLAECATAEGLSAKLCVVVSLCSRHPSRAIAQLKRNGIAVLLGGVGTDCRFSDMADRPLNGVVIDRALLAQACGNPQAASILDAIVALANNLGLKSFANECATESELQLALSAGVTYVCYASPRDDARALALLGAARRVYRDSGWRRPHRPS